jgi:hypothetical protein
MNAVGFIKGTQKSPITVFIGSSDWEIEICLCDANNAQALETSTFFLQV